MYSKIPQRGIKDTDQQDFLVKKTKSKRGIGTELMMKTVFLARRRIFGLHLTYEDRFS